MRRFTRLTTGRNCDHVAAFTARSTSRSQAGSTPGAARTTAPPISIVIAMAPRADAAAIVPSWRSSVTTGTNSGALSPASSATRLAPPCARRTGAAARYRFGAPPPTRPRRAHRIPLPFVPWPRHSSDADAPLPPGFRPCRVPQKFQLYGQPYMRLHISNVGHIVPVKSRVTRWGRRTAYGDPVIPEARAIQEDARDVSGTKVFNQRIDGRKVRGFVKAKHPFTSKWRRLMFNSALNFVAAPAPAADGRAPGPDNVYPLRPAG
jgi:hypothetical protein